MREVKIINSEPTPIPYYWKELIKYRNLIWVFAGQEIKTMYAQTYLGILWAVLRPLVTLAIFTAIFKFFLHVPTQSPYYLFAFSGMIAWNLFSNIASNASGAIVQKQNLIRKMYFPKLILVLYKIAIPCIESGISLAILLLLIMVERVGFNFNILLLPVFIFLNIVCGYTIAIWMNALNIRFRDLGQILPTILGIGVWVTPVFYPTTIIPNGYDFFIYVNPLACIIKGYRWALLGEPFPEYSYWFTIPAVFILALAGTLYFIRAEDSMVDSA